MLEKIKPGLFFISVVVLTGTLGFGLGRLSRIDEAREPVRIKQTAASAAAAPIPTVLGKYVASQSGTRYYLPSCSGVSRIKEENKIYFASKAEAEAAGLQPAANCPGI